jgi:hypothetical protein
VHAQCWSHTRREFLKAEKIEPELTEKALDFIRELYEAEGELKRRPVDGVKRLEFRARYCKPVVDKFFGWLEKTLSDHVLLPSNPFTEAARYAQAREGPLQVFLDLVDVLQRVEDHPASDVTALTPRLWKERFADNPRRSIIDR